VLRKIFQKGVVDLQTRKERKFIRAEPKRGVEKTGVVGGKKVVSLREGKGLVKGEVHLLNGMWGLGETEKNKTKESEDRTEMQTDTKSENMETGVGGS